MTRILVVCEDALLAARWAEVLEARGYTPDCYGSPDGVLRAACAEPPALVVLDLDLDPSPVHGPTPALDLLDDLRREFSEADLPILAVSGVEDADEIATAFAAGASDYLPKPLRGIELSSKAGLLLQRSARLKRATSSAQHLPGDVACGRFLVEEFLGQGSYGVVYGARCLESGASVALKLLSSRTPDDEARFLRECYTLAGLRHAGLARIVAYGVEAGTPFLAMERVVGVDLATLVEERGCLSEAETLDVLEGLAGALATLGARRLIHRDVKPQNVLLRGGRPDQPVLIDFGLARGVYETGLTSPDLMLGTPGYMPPEVLTGGTVDERVDLFALGMLARYLLVGVEAHPELGGLALLERMAREATPMPGWIDPELRLLLEDLTEPCPTQRLPSAAALLERLAALRLSSSFAREEPALAGALELRCAS